MYFLTVALAALSLQAGAPGAAWTWTLYEGEGPTVLAHEVPDTPQLRSTFECAPGSGVTRVAVYGGGLGGGFAMITAGTASATAQAEAGRGKLSFALRTDHPVFSQFVAAGGLTVTSGAQSQTVTVDRAHLTRLRRFAEICGG